MKKLLTLSLVACLGAVLFISCGGSDTKPDLYDLTISADKATIAADSVEAVTLTVKYKGEVVTEGVEIYVNENKVDMPNFQFKTNVDGSYKFRAKKGGDNSPSVVVLAKKNRNPGTFVKKALTLYLTTTWCNNCPTAMDIIKEAEKLYPNRIVTLTWHSTEQNIIHDPYALIQTHAIMTWLGGVGGYPMVNIDNEKMLYPGSGDKREFEYSFYETPTAGLVGLAIESNIKKTAGAPDSVFATVKMKNTSADLAGKVLKMNIVITEDNLVSNQIMPDGRTNPDYVHNHVVRHVVTPLTDNGAEFGTVIPADGKAVGGEYVYEFAYEVPKPGTAVPNEYNTANMNVAAFIILGAQDKNAPFIAAQTAKFGTKLDYEYNSK